MKKKIIYFLLLIGCSCSAQEAKDFVIKSTTQKVVLLTFSTEDIDKIKANFDNEDDFYTAADDVMYYDYQASEYLSEKNISFDTTNMHNPIYLIEENERLLIPEAMIWGGIFIYEKGKYKEFVNSIDIGNTWQFINGHWEVKQ
ncbi:MAG: hypothetical protein SO179_06565 [Bacteroidales bacterium]|nr:hypothetical protein [Bacteroidales bacterium]